MLVEHALFMTVPRGGSQSKQDQALVGRFRDQLSPRPVAREAELLSNGQKGLLSRWAARDRLPSMNANSTPTPGGGAQLTTSALFDDFRDCKSFNLREVGRGGGGRNYVGTESSGSYEECPAMQSNEKKGRETYLFPGCSLVSPESFSHELVGFRPQSNGTDGKPKSMAISYPNAHSWVHSVI
jgi:hypothetical protein